MTDQHPLTPPTELVQEWIAEAPPLKVSRSRQKDYYCIAEQAAQWGADQELKACRMEIIDGAGLFIIGETSDRVELANDLRNARRPKPPSLKEQALEALDEALFLADDDPPEGICSYQADIIRRALEALPND